MREGMEKREKEWKMWIKCESGKQWFNKKKKKRKKEDDENEKESKGKGW